VLVAIDSERRLNNGEPAALLRWFDSLGLQPGDRFLHVGCGVGHYTAIAAEAVRPGGRATGIEIDSGLAERARRSTARESGIEILSGDGSKLAERSFDAIFVNAGANEVAASWLDSLAPSGRLLLPLTVATSSVNAGVGWMLLVQSVAGAYSAEFRTPVGIYHCAARARTRARSACGPLLGGPAGGRAPPEPRWARRRRELRAARRYVLLVAPLKPARADVVTGPCAGG
jgi:protein-L-isoaspartate(D-aspartate) O-methyltransferase